MRRLYGLIGATVGGWLGWAAGAWISIFVAFILSVVGTGVGLYLGYRLAARYS
jgi:hypothetical protein